MNISGGTEVAAGFLGAPPYLPHKPCTLGRPILGMAMDVYDPAGEPLRGEVGELVCTQPWPGMTRGIWGDPERYLDTYWRRFPGVWTHGDWATIDADGDWFLHGRSDDTLNVAGKRIGPAEYESALVGDPAVAEACAVGVPARREGRGRVVLLRAAHRASSRARSCERGCAPAAPRSSARPSRRPRCASRRRCRRPAAPRSCAARCAPRCSARIPATSRRSRIPRRSTPCARAKPPRRPRATRSTARPRPGTTSSEASSTGSLLGRVRPGAAGTAARRPRGVPASEYAMRSG